MALADLFAVGDDSPAERINLIRTAFIAFSAIGELFGPSLREEIRAVAVSIYAGAHLLLSSIELIFR